MPAKSLPSTGIAPAARRCDTQDVVMIHRFLRIMFADAVRLVDGVKGGDRRQAEHGRQTVPRDWAFIQIGFMLDTMPPADREAFLSGLRGFIRLLWTSIGRTQYRRKRARLYGPDTTSHTTATALAPEQNGTR